MTSITKSALTSDISSSMTELIDDLHGMTEALGRTDLSNRLNLANARMLDQRLRVVVAGSAKNGMSALTDALVASNACGKNSDVPVFVGHGEDASSKAVTSADGRLVRTEVTLPHDLVSEGITFVDTPGISGGLSERSTAVLALTPTADAVLFVSDASQEFTAPEIALLGQMKRLCPFVVCVLTKIDSYAHWADISRANRQHLTSAGLDLPILPVSARIADLARDVEDDELLIESGLPQLTEFIRTRFVAQYDSVIRNSVINDISVVSDHLALALNTEKSALAHPADNAALVAEMQSTRDAADRLRRRTANWQHILTDGAVELITDIEHDLRNRLRVIIRESDADIMKSDPAPRWEEFGEELQEKVASAVRENFVMAHTRSIEVARQVADRFADHGQVGLPDLRIDDIDNILDPVTSLECLESKPGIVQCTISSVRGSYGGILMVGLATSLMGLALVNAFSIGAGVLLGANTFREDRKSRTARRQAEAKVAVARLMDDVIFQVNKESKQRLREIQRVLRDHFTEIANEMLRSVNDSLRAAQSATKMHEVARAKRVRVIESHLDGLRRIRLRAADVLTGGIVG